MVAWAPTLNAVADWVPWLTVDTITPGSQAYLGVFTTVTSPTAEQAQRVIDREAVVIGAGLGELPASLYPLAAAVTALRAAIALARTYPRDSRDLAYADSLAAQMGADYAALVAAADQAGTATTTPQPVMYAPSPCWWGDINL